MTYPKGSFTYYPTHTMPAMLDVVWTCFPQDEAPAKPGPKSRPALVRRVCLYRKHTIVAVEVTYGTSKLDKVHMLDLQIGNTEELDAAGCWQSTGFRLDKTKMLPWCTEFFPIPDGKKTPVIGQLHPRTVAQLEALKVQRRVAGMDPT